MGDSPVGWRAARYSDASGPVAERGKRRPAWKGGTPEGGSVGPLRAAGAKLGEEGDDVGEVDRAEGGGGVGGGVAVADSPWPLGRLPGFIATA